jgi:dipeptidyl-peptidase-4
MFSQEEITVEKIWKYYNYYPNRAEGYNAMSDGVSYSVRESNNTIVKRSFEGKNKEELIFKPTDDFVYDGYEFNADESKVLFLTDLKNIYRYSYSANYYLFDRETEKIQPLDEKRQPQTLAEYSPDGNHVSYIYENNIYVKNLKTGIVIELTSDGEKNALINGTTDWVYEEEFAFIKAYDWSPDSKYIAYLKFNERHVKEFSMTFYNELYPDSYDFKYPKAGEDNSKVSVHIADIDGGKEQEIFIGQYEYIPRVEWSPSMNQLILQSMNRHQSSLKYHLVELQEDMWVPSIVFEEKSETYVDVDDNLVFLKDGNSLLRTSEIDGYKHIYKLSFDGTHTQVTSGKWDVIDFLGLDTKSNTIYYSSCEPDATQKSVYGIQVNGKNKKELTNAKGYNDAEFLKGMKYFIHTYSNANTPPVICLRNAKGKLIKTLEDNSRLAKLLSSSYALSPKTISTIETDNAILNTWMILPHDFDSTKKYPVYFNVYGGPGHNEVLDSWDGSDYMYHQLLAQHGYIVFCVDPRGTMYRGAEFKKSTYLELGKLETEDILNCAKVLGEYSWIDKERIGIMGWSYGGFMSSLAITKGADLFKMAISVAPVTSWRYYDNIYTERFMRTPQENEKGYDDNSPINHVSKLKGNYLLIHGAADDNVHYQNTMEMVNAMVAANKQFDLFIYPNKNHGIYGGNTRNHLFQMMFDYILENL